MRRREYAELFSLLAFLTILLTLYGITGPEAATQFALAPSPAAEPASSAEASSKASPAEASAAAKQLSATPSRSAGIQKAAPTVDPFGIGEEHFSAEKQRIQKNQTFGEILSAHGVSPADVTRIAEQARPAFEVRHLRAGRSYRVYTDAWLDRARYFVYQPDPVHYVVLDLADSVVVRTGKRPVDVVRKEAEGTIRSSLYDTLAEADVDPSLAFDLSDVFAWQIDFYRIQKGDNFSVIYEERQIDGRPVGLGKIIAARFEHQGDDYYGLHFEQNGKGDYFDEKGESLRKALLKAPLRYRRISSRYTKRRYHPVQKRWKAHLGTDYAAAPGTPVHSVGDGTVLEAGYSRYNGNWVKIRHNATYTTGYLHFSRIAKGIKPGVEVEQGQTIGYVGSTGLATGPHVCYRFWKKGRQVDPLKEEMPSSDPVEQEHLIAYNRLKYKLLPQLRSDTPSLADEGGARFSAPAADLASSR